MTRSPTSPPSSIEATNSVSYLVADPASRAAAVIDPVLDFDAGERAESKRTRPTRILAAAAGEGLTHRLGAGNARRMPIICRPRTIRDRTGAKVGVGAGIREVQARFAPVFEADDLADGRFRPAVRRRRDACRSAISRSK